MDPFGVFSKHPHAYCLPFILWSILIYWHSQIPCGWSPCHSVQTPAQLARPAGGGNPKSKKDFLHFHFFTDRSEHDSLVSRDAGPLPRTLRTLPPSQAWSHHFAHLHQPHQVNITKVVKKQDKLKTLNSEHKHQWNIKFGIQTSISWVNKQNTNTNLSEIWFCLDVTLASLAIQFNLLKQKQQIMIKI